MIALALALGCTKTPPNEAPTRPGPTTKTGLALESPPSGANATVTLTSVTFGDNCDGDTTPLGPPVPLPPSPHAAQAGPAAVPPTSMRAPMPSDRASVENRCDPSSMQLVVVAKAATDVQIKSVEVIDDTNKSLGQLTSSRPVQWNATASKYAAWDGKVAAGQTAQVSYLLSQPKLDSTWQYMSHDHTYTVKVVASVGGVDQPVQTTVMIVAMPAPVPT